MYIKNYLILIAFIIFPSLISYEMFEEEKALILYLKKSTFLSEDLKKACHEYPEFYHKLGVKIPVILYYASQRPDIIDVDEVEQRILEGKTKVMDFIITGNCQSSYGEATISENKLRALSSEPTDDGRKKDRYYCFLPQTPEFKSALQESYDIISKLGNQVSWDEAKIKTECDFFNKQLVEILYNCPEKFPIYSSRVLNSKEKKLEDNIKKMEDELVELKNDGSKNGIYKLNDCEIFLMQLMKIKNGFNILQSKESNLQSLDLEKLRIKLEEEKSKTSINRDELNKLKAKIDEHSWNKHLAFGKKITVAACAIGILYLIKKNYR